jgi:AcrR family transcriptional regulator
MNLHANDARRRILLKAKEKFSTLGYSKTSMDEIATELGMSKKTLYKFFPTKLQLAEELMAHTFGELDRRCDAILASPLSAIEKLFRIIELVADLQNRLVTKVMIESLHTHLPHLWQGIETFRRERMHKNMQAIFEQGIRDGTIRTGLDRRMFLHFVHGAIQEGICPEVLINASYSMHEAVLALIDIFMNGVLTESGREQYQKLTAAKAESF